MTDGLGWEVRTLADAFTPRPPLQWAIEGVTSMPSLSIWYGRPGCFKSMLLMDALLCVAAGVPWLEPLPGRHDVSPIKTTSVPTLWLDFDQGGRRVAERAEALAKARGFNPQDVPFHWVAMPSPWLDAGKSGQVGQLADLLNDYGVGLAAIDNLRTISGTADENAPEIGIVMSNLRQLTEATGSGMIVAHHQTKNPGTRGRLGDTLRGHSSIEASLDLALLIERDEQAPDALIRSTKTRDVDVLPFGATFTYKHKPGTSELAEARFFGQPIIDETPRARATRAVLLSLEGLTKPVTKTALVDAAKNADGGVGEKRLRDAIDCLTRSGKLTMTPGERRAQYYVLSTTSAANGQSVAEEYTGLPE